MARVFSQDIISVADSADLEPATAITVGGWVYITNSPGDYQRVFGKGYDNYGSAPYVSYNIQQNSTNVRVLEFNIAVSGTLYATGVTSALNASTWYFVAGRWSSGNTTEIRVFNADGSLFSSNTGGSPSGSITYDTTPFEITDGGDGGSKPDGNFDWVLVDDVSYTDEQIKTFMYTCRPVGSCNLLLDLGPTVVDRSGNKGSVTVTGTAVGDGPPIGPPFGYTDYSPYIVSVGGGATGKSNPLSGPLGGPLAGGL